MDAIQFITEVAHAIAKNGWSLTTLIIAVTALLRVNAVRRVILRRLPKRFRYEDKLERMERKIDALSAHMGVPKCDLPQTTLNVQLTPLCGKSISLLQVGNRLANQLRRMKNKMSKIDKLVLLPLIAAIANFLRDAFGIEIGTDQQELIVTGILTMIFIWGIVRNFIKKSAKEVEPNVRTVAEVDSNDYSGLDAERESAV